MNAAISLGLGTCYLGVIRTNADKVIDLLNIKGKCIPVIAVAIGYTDKPTIKTPKHNKVYDEKYDISLNLPELKKVLLVATGALHSQTTVNQKLNIPAIAHAISLEVVR